MCEQFPTAESILQEVLAQEQARVEELEAIRSCCVVSSNHTTFAIVLESCLGRNAAAPAEGVVAAASQRAGA